MIIYRDAEREISPVEEFGALRRAAAAGDALGFLVRLGEFEQALVDAVRPRSDGWGPVQATLRRAAVLAGAGVLAAEGGRAPHGPLHEALTMLDRLDRASLPRRLRVRPPEGYAHYALDPRAYAAAAAAYRAEAGAARASRAIVIGVRSIGTGLSAVVAAALGASCTVTVRPRGESGRRHIAAGPRLSRIVARRLHEDADALVVDEGPGATGETFAVVAEWVRSLGADDGRIILFPSSARGMPLAAAERRNWFAAARKYPPPLGDNRPTRLAARIGLDVLEDLSAGRWRDHVPGATGLPASTGHERLKYRARRGDGVACILRYAGLGRWGEETRGRAERLAGAGLGPDVLGAGDGFLLLRWTDGTPVTSRAGQDPRFLDFAGRYLATRLSLFPAGRDVDPEPILGMLRANAGEALGAAVPGLAAALRRLERLPPAPAVVPDARVQPREWLATPGGYAKVDALDHGDGLRLPGPTHAAWDVAGVAVEFDLDRPAVESLVRRCAAAAGSDARGFAEAVAALRPAYAALQLGEATLAVREGATDGDRACWAAETARYRRALARELSGAGGGELPPRR